jgi:DHA3 family macrolide efflux protein-like MFS transporter
MSEQILVGTTVPKKLWNFNYLLLWQGQFVSAIGDTVYEIALGFWILAITGSTALMGTLMAASTIPRIAMAPFAGVFVDRTDRKWLMVAMDAVRGIAVVLVAVAVFTGNAAVWMVFAAGIIIGLCAAFFNLCIGSVIPDLVAREQLVQANSFFSMIRAGSGILGNSAGGVLYTVLGAPIIFLANGISYLFSAFTEIFIKVPALHRGREKKLFFQDMRDGLTFVWRNSGLRFLLLAASVMNFFSFVGIVLLIPFFKRTEWLGAAHYGIIMAVFTIGMLLGMGTTAAIPIAADRRLLVFGVSTICFVIPLTALPFLGTFWLMVICAIVGGYFNAIINVLIDSVLQLSVPQEFRGKVLGLVETLAGGLSPVGMAVGGLLGEYLPLHWVIGGAFFMVGLFIFPQLRARGLRKFFGISSRVDAGGTPPADGTSQGGGAAQAAGT